ncbi:MAG: flagellar basal body P-ring formation protein FlgA [Syntrophorhabdaceae bacterium]|nr:flagellar basal body P-ring formation protein FlgA [Syntrophorhabdaceae bacterium]
MGTVTEGPESRHTSREPVMTVACYAGLIALFFLLFLLAAAGSGRGLYAAGESATETRIIGFIKQIYPGGDAVRVRLNSMPSQLRNNAKIVNLSFSRIPDVSGEGICAVEIENSPGRTRTVQIPFKVFTKRELFMLKQAGQKGDTIGMNDILVRQTYMNGNGAGYPAAAEDVIGKVLKRDVPANTLITDRILDDRVVLKRGDVVTIIAESNKLVVQAKGKTVDKGRIGDTIRVKNIASGKELTARVVSGSEVKVEF